MHMRLLLSLPLGLLFLYTAAASEIGDGLASRYLDEREAAVAAFAALSEGERRATVPALVALIAEPPHAHAAVAAASALATTQTPLPGAEAPLREAFLTALADGRRTATLAQGRAWAAVGPEKERAWRDALVWLAAEAIRFKDDAVRELVATTLVDQDARAGRETLLPLVGTRSGFVLETVLRSIVASDADFAAALATLDGLTDEHPDARPEIQHVLSAIKTENQPPQVEIEAPGEVVEGGKATITVSIRDHDDLRLALETRPGQKPRLGKVSQADRRHFTYIALPRRVGTDSFTIIARDGSGGETETAVEINVLSDTTPPVVTASSFDQEKKAILVAFSEPIVTKPAPTFSLTGAELTEVVFAASGRSARLVLAQDADGPMELTADGVKDLSAAGNVPEQTRMAVETITLKAGLNRSRYPLEALEAVLDGSAGSVAQEAVPGLPEGDELTALNGSVLLYEGFLKIPVTDGWWNFSGKNQGCRFKVEMDGAELIASPGFGKGRTSVSKLRPFAGLHSFRAVVVVDEAGATFEVSTFNPDGDRGYSTLTADYFWSIDGR